MPVFYGTLNDFGLDPQPGMHPIISFHPSGGGVGVGRVFFDRVIPSTPNAEGVFTVTLADLSDVRPALWYRMSVRWLNGEGVPVGFTDIPGRLFTTAAGGPISDWIEADGSSPGLIWYGLEPPATRGRFVAWNKVDLTNLEDDDDPTLGDIYEWSN